MKLPEKGKEGFTLSRIRALFYGPPKIGKSTLCSKFDDAIFAATEKGLRALEVAKVDIGDWDDFLEFTYLILRGKHSYRTVVIDTTDNLFKFCQDYVLKAQKMDHPSDGQWGKGWELVRKEFEIPLLKLAMSDYGVLFTSHMAEREVKGKGVKYNKTQPSMPNQARSVVMPLVDIIGYCFTEEETEGGDEKRLIQFAPTMYVEAGDRTKLLPATIPLRYGNFQKYFKQKQEE